MVDVVIPVEIPMFNLLNGPLTRKTFTASGGAKWTKNPPETVDTDTPVHAEAQVPSKGIVDAYYSYNPDSPVLFYWQVMDQAGKIVAKAGTITPGYTAEVIVTEGPKKILVAITFKKV